MESTVVSFVACIVAVIAGLQSKMIGFQADPEHAALHFSVDHISDAGTPGHFTEPSVKSMPATNSQTIGDVWDHINSGPVNTPKAARHGQVRSRGFPDVSEHSKIAFSTKGAGLVLVYYYPTQRLQHGMRNHLVGDIEKIIIGTKATKMERSKGKTGAVV